VLLAAVALLVVYAALSLFNAPRGTLGTDTGGKIASLDAMKRNGGLDPDLGYWAERWDPKGTLHPIYYTAHIGKRWVNLTTLPMPVVALPLFELGGIRAALLLPMLGSILSALAARALARRLASERAGWWAFWLTGLASPLTVYALDFWEHSLGVAAVLWAAVFAYDLAFEQAGPWGALTAGGLLGVAATMRTEALVYALVIGAVTAIALWRRRHRVWLVARLAVPAAAGAVIALAANEALERLILSDSLRAARATATAGVGGGDVVVRAKEAIITFLGLNRFGQPQDWFLGALVVGAVLYGMWRVTSADTRTRQLGTIALGAAAVFYLVWLAFGLGFLPGLLTASPLAATGLMRGLTCARLRPVVAVALLALPIVWAFQYSGGANPQWGGRYLLISGALLGVCAAVALSDAPGRGRWLVVALAVGVTSFGMAWLSVRSHAVADAMEVIARPTSGVVISQEPHVLREGGAFYSPSRRWLTAVGGRELHRAFHVAAESGVRVVTLVGVVGRSRPASVSGFDRGRSTRREFLPGVTVLLTRYQRA